MDYYFELNPLISFGNRLNEVRKLEPSIFTSIWAMMELIAELKSETFLSNKARLSTIINSGIRIHWDDPITILYSSFNVPNIENYRMDSCKTIINDILSSISFDDLKSRFPVSFYAVSILSNLRQESRGLITKINGLMNSASKATIEKKMETYHFDEEYIKNLAIYLSEISGIDTQKILDGYSGRLKYFIHGLEKATTNMIQLDRNDEIDLYHLFYMKDETTYMVSNDAIFSKVEFRNLIPVGDFKRKIGWCNQ